MTEQVIIVDKRTLVTLASRPANGDHALTPAQRLDVLFDSGQRIVILPDIRLEMENAPPSIKAAFFDNYERTVYAGDNQAGGLPGVFSFDNAFSPLHSYQTGYYSFNDGGAEFVDGEWDISYDIVQYIDYTDDYYADFYETNSEVYYGGQYDFDTSSLDYNYEDWNAEAYLDSSFEAFTTYSLDGWDYGNSYQPIILDTEHGHHNCAAVMRLRHATNQKDGNGFVAANDNSSLCLAA